LKQYHKCWNFGGVFDQQVYQDSNDERVTFSLAGVKVRTQVQLSWEPSVALNIAQVEYNGSIFLVPYETIEKLVPDPIWNHDKAGPMEGTVQIIDDEASYKEEFKIYRKHKDTLISNDLQQYLWSNEHPLLVGK